MRNSIQDALHQQHFVVVPAGNIPPLQKYTHAWSALTAEYPHLPPDEYLPDGGRYRFRRYDRFHFDPTNGSLELLPHQDYFQSTDINQVTGGIVRKFAPLTPELAANEFLHAMIRWDFAQLPMRDPAWSTSLWQVDVHMIYVVATPDGEGHPTPEGIHRDGAEYVTVHLAALENAEGGVVTIYDDHKQPIESFQLANLMDSYLFEDLYLWHGATPIHPLDGVSPAKRGILTFDYHFLNQPVSQI